MQNRDSVDFEFAVDGGFPSIDYCYYGCCFYLGGFVGCSIDCCGYVDFDCRILVGIVVAVVVADHCLVLVADVVSVMVDF